MRQTSKSLNTYLGYQYHRSDDVWGGQTPVVLSVVWATPLQ
jgi:hypothetical protein